MDPIFETDYPVDTAGITVPGAEVKILGARDGKFLVSCAHSVGVAQGWRRRSDIEAEREAQTNAELAAMAAYEAMSEAERAAFDKAKADAVAADAVAREARARADVALAAASAKGKAKK